MGGTDRVLLASCAQWPTGHEDGELLLAALHRRGVAAQWAVWTDPEVDWDGALVIVRTTWDYTRQRDRFLGWVAGLDRVLNPAEVISWNTDKRYLADLARAGVPTVDTIWAAPGDPVELPTDADCAEFVVKPAVGSGSRGAGRFAADERSAALVHVAALHAAGSTAMVQPYLRAVDADGETALIYFDGRFSHAVTKSAMLPAGVVHPPEAWVRYVAEKIEPRTPTEAQLTVADQAVAAVRERFGCVPLYARVDLLPGDDGPVLVELELTEPGLFLGHGTGPHDPADTFAAAVAARR